MSRSSLVLGANGQDGRLLLRLLQADGRPTLGVGRQSESREPQGVGFEYRALDLRDPSALPRLLAATQPDDVYHLAAVHTSAGGRHEEIFGDMLAVNVATVHAVLEYMKARPGARLVYAGSAKVFGAPLPARIDRRTPRRGQCLYALTKNLSHDLIEHYRREYGLQASVVTFFNHESELRPLPFFVPTIAEALRRARTEPDHSIEVQTLGFYCDWGSAAEYMELVRDIADRACGQDFLLATGSCTFARTLVSQVFAAAGLDYRRHVRERLPEGEQDFPYTVELEPLRRALGRTPRVGITEVLARMSRAAAGARPRPALPPLAAAEP